MVQGVGNILDIMFRMEGMTEDLNIDITGITVSDERLIIKGITRSVN
jgi:hypothetical protein